MQIENPQGATPDATFHTCYVALTLARARRDNVNFVVDRVRVTASFHRSPDLGEFATIQLNGRCGTVVETTETSRSSTGWLTPWPIRLWLTPLRSWSGQPLPGRRGESLVALAGHQRLSFSFLLFYCFSASVSTCCMMLASSPKLAM